MSFQYIFDRLVHTGNKLGPNEERERERECNRKGGSFVIIFFNEECNLSSSIGKEKCHDI